MAKLDKIDLKIVDFLMKDGRTQASEIARALGISERTVRYRINNLLKSGVIRVQAFVNPAAVGFPVFADVFVEIEPHEIQEVAQKIAKFDLVAYASCTMGETDMSLQVVARDNTELFNFVTKVLSKVPGVKKTTTFIIPMILKDINEWRIPSSVLENNDSQTKGKVPGEETQEDEE